MILNRVLRLDHGANLRQISPILPDILTILSVLVSLIGYNCIKFLNIETALRIVVITATLDAFDGKLARLFKHQDQKEFGKLMDSTADFINFGLFPASIIWVKLGLVWLSLTYIAAVSYRLIRFYKSSTPDSALTYIGVPSPMGAIIAMSGLILPTQYSIYVVILSILLMIMNIPTIVLHRLTPRDTQLFYITVSALIAIALASSWGLLIISLLYMSTIPFTNAICSRLISRIIR